MQVLIDLIKKNQLFLMKRVLEYAKLHGYTKYTSTLEEAWVASVSGLSQALIDAILHDPKVPEMEVDHDYSNNPISSFGVLEAQKHRYRGVSLSMFLALMKYYRQAYLDLVTESVQDSDQQRVFLLWINRFYDHNELSYCYEWTAHSKETLLSELQVANRILTNEKNKYLTIFESMPTPAIILDVQHYCINMNYAAQQILNGNTYSPGHMYYSNCHQKPKLSEVLPWINDEFMDFCNGDILETNIEKDFESPTQGKRNFVIKFHRMLDVSNKFEGTVILFNDLTEYKKIQEQLRHISFHDQLTGLYNRSYMEEEIIQLATGRFNPVGFISIDVDGLKLVNDNLGHNAGDTLLITVSQIIKKCFQESDVIVRMGGDEFSVIMPLSDMETVQKACQIIRDKIDEHNNVNLSMPISISIGGSSGNFRIKSDVFEIIKKADKRMYADKQINHSKYEALFNERFYKYGEKLFFL